VWLTDNSQVIILECVVGLTDNSRVIILECFVVTILLGCSVDDRQLTSDNHGVFHCDYLARVGEGGRQTTHG
jgi:hypothetical protein